MTKSKTTATWWLVKYVKEKRTLYTVTLMYCLVHMVIANTYRASFASKKYVDYRTPYTTENVILRYGFRPYRTGTEPRPQTSALPMDNKESLTQLTGHSHSTPQHAVFELLYRNFS